MGAKKKSEAVIKYIKRRTGRTFSSEEKNAIVLKGLRFEPNQDTTISEEQFSVFLL